MKYLITGGLGFVGSNIAASLMEQGETVVAFDNFARQGAEANGLWLQGLGKLQIVRGDVRNPSEIESVLKSLKPDVIFHLAGQVAMTTSMQNPRLDFETNVLGSINLLEGVRAHCPGAIIVYSSSNKVYGSLAGVTLREDALRYSAPDFPEGISESAPLDFHTPYGCSKGAADQYMLDYARCYGLRTVVFRHSTIYGGRQYATFDQGWVGWFCTQAAEVKKNPGRKPFTIAGDGKQVRDLLYVEDAVRCYLAAANHIEKAKGEAFNIGGGFDNSSSLLELFALLEQQLDVRLIHEKTDWRHDDQKLFIADNSKARRLLGWVPQVSKLEGVKHMLKWVSSL